LVAVGAGLVFVMMTFAPAQVQPQPVNPNSGLTINGTEIIQQFPMNGPMQTAWKVRYREQNGPGLIIMEAYFKKGPTEDWTQVLGEARLAEAFVPYHRGSPRFWDVSIGFPLCVVDQQDAGPRGKLLSAQPGQPPRVVLEQRDDGIAFKDSSGVRRGEILVLWGAMSAANYRYLIEYGFRDDGLIRFRCGATGHNYPGSEWEPHMHNAWWRVDVNLGGPNNNSVEMVEHIEPDPNGGKGTAFSLRTPFNNGKEGYADFTAEKFTMLRVLNTQKKNVRNMPWAYDLVPYRMGNSRHHASSKEDCSHHDYWVTKNGKGEVLYHELPQYVKNGENITNTDIVLWYSAAGHHEPRSEDGEMRQNKFGGKSFQGVTPVMWTTFELRPRDFWDRSPFSPFKN
jgi:primary-amine oxidase